MIDVNEIFVYCPLSGVIRNRITRSHNAKAGDEAGCQQARGYRSTKVNGKPRYAHQLALQLSGVDVPSWMRVDHIDGDRTNNRLNNLRVVTPTGNNRNQKKPKDNKSGTMGVRLYKRTGKWDAYITVSGIQLHLGYFNIKEDAIAARKAAEKAHGFHENHGRKG